MHALREFDRKRGDIFPRGMSGGASGPIQNCSPIEKGQKNSVTFDNSIACDFTEMRCRAASVKAVPRTAGFFPRSLIGKRPFYERERFPVIQRPSRHHPTFSGTVMCSHTRSENISLA